ncbi:fimbrial-like adhesin protein StcD [Escherichia coli]|uniref:Fimbrial-like adhesin protein StcD n=1 Tax=Escherichia coli TaxID=562 RepID=A0A377B8C7_ECOLX|nr:fimbrial-like adhesin protein StcD [Escherichia coli]
MEIRIMLFILMMMVMPVSYAAFIVSYLFSTTWLFRGILHLLKHKWRHMSII